MTQDRSETAGKIARLVAERGWSQNQFAQEAGISRLTARNILLGRGKGMRLGTLSRCAHALAMTVSELLDTPFERLLLRYQEARGCSGSVAQLYDLASQPEVREWLSQNPHRAMQLSTDERDELLSLQGVGGPLTRQGVEHYIQLIERRRRLLAKVEDIANTDYIDLLEQLIELLHDKVQPFRDARLGGSSQIAT